ncbi:dihydroorotate dehydrogenase electron transfer subunit [Schlesneria paludicola]|uniref:dihydroorotate dehydrogenase electron transfer subunit n=1 Tax=Schlesneria paludicola TaxID=360056 RepID=UPI00029B163B|nr:dihydroorotate dehydrogenase electron transfer subunit [Schlesneria paludicola]
MNDVVLDLPGVVSTAVQESATVVEHELMAKNTWRMRLSCPAIARQIVPGQFFMVRIPGRSDPLLGRPFALYDIYTDADGHPAGLDFGYVVVGKMTSVLESLSVGSRVEMWGPLGNGFPLPPSGHLVIAAGGIGQTPFLAVVREALKRRVYGDPARIVCTAPSRITLCYGVRGVEYLAGVEEFQAEGIDVRISTDDGSAGRRGFVTDVLKNVFAEKPAATALYCCGPEPMMQAVNRLAASVRIPTWLSLETPMACGFGACFSCVTKIRQDDGTWDYRRVCVEGPVFPGDKVVFHE